MWARNLRLSWQKSISKSPGLDFEAMFHPLEILLFGLCEYALVIGFSGREHVENDSRQLMGRCGDRFWCS